VRTKRVYRENLDVYKGKTQLFSADLFGNFDRWSTPISRVYPDGQRIDMPGSGKLRQRNDSDGHTSWINP
jgi:hypothetical protein